MEERKHLLEDKNLEWLSATLLSLGDGILATNVLGEVIFVNGQALEILGLNADQIIGNGLEEVLNIKVDHYSDAINFMSRSGGVLNYSGGLPKDAYIQTPNQEKKYLSAKITKLILEDQSQGGQIVVFRDITSHVLVEKRNMREKKNLENIFEYLPDGMVMLSKDLKVIRANQTFLKIFDQNLESIINKRFGEATRCVWRKEFGCGKSFRCSICSLAGLVDRLTRSGEIIKHERFQLHIEKDNKVAYYWFNVSVMTVQYDESIQFLVILNDITESVYYEETLKEARNMSLMLLDHLPVMIARYQSDFSCPFINKAFNAFMGMDLEPRPLHLEIESRLPRADLDRFNHALSEAFSIYKASRMELSLKNIRGELRYMSVWVLPIIEKDTENHSVMVVFLDIHEARLAQQMFLKSQNRYRLLFENLDLSLSYHQVIRDEQGKIKDFKIIEANSATETFFKGLHYDFTNKYISEIDIIPKETKERLKYHFERVLNTKETLHLNDIYFHPLNKWLDISIYTPEPEYVIVLINDVDYKKRASLALQAAKERLEEANKAKSSFLANMSHEIRTPLNGIVGMIDLTLLDALSQEQKGNLHIAKECVKSLLDIINDVLEFSKIEAGKLNILPENTNIRELIDASVKPHYPHAESRGIDLILDYKTPLSPLLIADGKRIKQILNNLISNAIKFTDIGSVTIEVSEESRETSGVNFSVLVKDTGIGIPNEKQSDLFKSFSQVDDTFTRQHGGTGLGLVICKQLIELMGGTIIFSSQYGQGSTFGFVIPLEKGTGEIKEESTHLEAQDTFEGVRVLLVEDDKVNHIVMSKILEKMKVQVFFAENGEEALEIFETEPIDLVLMDIQMPIMDGITATKKIREEEVVKGKGEHVPIIALTAYALEGDEALFISSGMDGYISKPVHRQTLVRTLRRYVHTHKDTEDRSELLERRIHAFGEHKPLAFDELMVKNARALTLDIKKRLEQESWEMLEVLAHELKKNFEKMGAEELKQLAFKMEIEIRKERKEKVIDYIQPIDRILSSLFN